MSADTGTPERNTPGPLDRDSRRTQVAAMVLAKRTYREIAEQFGVGVATIHRDVTAIRQGWRERAGALYADHVAEEVAKLDGVERGLVAKAFLGQTDAVHALLRLMERRARLLGLDRPFKLEATLDPEQTAELLSEAIEGVLAELGIDRADAAPVVARHLELVADKVDGKAA